MMDEKKWEAVRVAKIVKGKRKNKVKTKKMNRPTPQWKSNTDKECNRGRQREDTKRLTRTGPTKKKGKGVVDSYTSMGRERGKATTHKHFSRGKPRGHRGVWEKRVGK